MLRAILTRLAIVSLLVPTFLALVPAGPALATPGLTVQDQTTAGVTPTSLAQSLAGAGVTISNVTYAGTTRSSGQFQGGTTIIGFDSGVILSSGFSTDVIGPNNNDGLSRQNGTGGDADLTALSGFQTFDRTVLEFDLVPQASTLTFQYVFASEEYNEYANTQFNDVFAFFVNGTNCATVPGTVPPQPVSINTINGGNPLGTNPKNPLLYRNNDLSDGGGLIDTQADGLTVVLTCTAAVNPGVTNHIKLAIADGSDQILDSYVFLKAGSFVSSNITLAPATDTNPTGTTHTVTATVTENGQPAPGKVVTFTVTAGPHIGMTGVGTTNASGQATFTYTGVNAGTDTIKASYVSPTGPQESNAVTKIWEFVGAATLTLSPKADSNPVRTQHCVTATALNTAGGPAANIVVVFAVSGSVTATGSDTTDATGQAKFCYSGPTFPGDDLISAYADNNKNGTKQSDEPSDTATKAWVIPASTANCKVTFGGRITVTNGDKATFGGNAKATPSGNIQYTDHGPADAANVQSTDVFAVMCASDGVSATIYGEAMDNDTGPWMFRIDLTDMAEPGRNDTFRIQLTNGYDSGEQTLEKGGNIQLH
jgi:Big-like domain-containing protein